MGNRDLVILFYSFFVILYRYITSYYWTITTLSTLGYGDIFGFSTNEYIFTMIIEFLGIFVFAYMMGNINNLV